MNKLFSFVSGLILLWGFSGCAPTSDELWAGRFSKDQKIEISITRAEKWIADGKKIPDPALLAQAKQELLFLSEKFNYQPAKDKIMELDKFLSDFTSLKEKAARDAASKNNVFTAAGHYKALLALIPDHAEAKTYLSSNEAEIMKRLQKNILDGNAAVKSKDFPTAKRCFTRVLAYDSQNQDALDGLKSVKKGEKVVTKTEDKDQIYKKGLDAYEKKDFLKAYEFFNAIDDSSYKDTTLYIQRSQDKIETLGLDGKEN
ncbi:MAG: hypothetical protein J0L62_13040 [Bacteroidetes bacterium]|nr:hypothetical protein [Bacteroidota bacterium]